MENSEVARTLSEIADLLELKEGNPFKVRAYRQAALVVDTLPGPVADLWASGVLTSIPGIGESIATKIGELLETGRMKEHDALAREVPAGLLEMLRLEGLGPKTVAMVWKALKVQSVDELEKAVINGRLLKLRGMGEKKAQNILEAIQRHRRRSARFPLYRALVVAESILARLRALPQVTRAEVAGSVRRRKETAGDLDLLVASDHAEPVMNAFVRMPDVAEIISEGPTRSSIRLRSGLQADLRVLKASSFGAALHYFTGSQAHNIALRTRAVRLGLKVNEYGVFDSKNRQLGGRNEEDIFRAVGLPWIPPELREGTGELEAAEKGKLPRLVEVDDIVGDLHVHSDASPDAQSSVSELLQEARRLERHYIAITDHSRSRPNGLDGPATLINAEGIRTIRRKHRGTPHLLTGTEVDILWNGTLDLPLDVLAQLDWVVASIHTRFHDPPERITERMIKAMRSGVVDVIGHPSGRLLGSRDPYEFDLHRVLEVAREEGVALEVNAQPERLDLNDRMSRLAKDAGVKVVISSDAHLARQLGNIYFGVWTARRGWLEAKDVLNTTDEPWERAKRRKRRQVPPHVNAGTAHLRETRASSSPGSTSW